MTKHKKNNIISRKINHFSEILCKNIVKMNDFVKCVGKNHINNNKLLAPVVLH